MKTSNISALCRENLVKSTHQDSIRLISLWGKILPSLISLYLKFAILEKNLLRGLTDHRWIAAA